MFQMVKHGQKKNIISDWLMMKGVGILGSVSVVGPCN